MITPLDQVLLALSVAFLSVAVWLAVDMAVTRYERRHLDARLEEIAALPIAKLMLDPPRPIDSSPAGPIGRLHVVLIEPADRDDPEPLLPAWLDTPMPDDGVRSA